MDDTGDFPLSVLPAWCALNDISFIDIKVDEVKGKGRGLVAEKYLINDQDNPELPTLLTVPKDLILSPEAVSEYAKEDQNFRQLLDVTGRQSHRGDILIFLFVQMILASRNHNSIKTPWSQYCNLLPRHIPVPTMWTETETDLLLGTSLQPALAAKHAALTREFEHLRETSSDLPYWYDLLWADNKTMLRDWILVDALYRSRSLELPKSGEAMVPCLDFANHSCSNATAYFDENGKDEVCLLLRRGQSVQKGEEITIDYGSAKSAAETLFSYGFIDSGNTARKIGFPLQPLDGDPLAKAKLHVFDGRPSLEIEEGEDGIPTWTAPFGYLACLNEEDGLSFRLLQETDGSTSLKVFWQDDDITGHVGRIGELVQAHELGPLFNLRVVTVVLQKVADQIAELEVQGLDKVTQDSVSAEVMDSVMKLRELELDLLILCQKALEDQRDNLMGDEAVQKYLGSIRPAAELSDKKPDSQELVEDDDFS